MTHGFHVAMAACAGLAVVGGNLAWLTISDEVLHTEPEPAGGTPVQIGSDYSCSVAGTALRPAREAECHPVAVEKVAASAR
jgi:hypothetical protein